MTADVTVHHGKCEDVLPTLAAGSIDACVTDPPYEFSFMGKSWDGTGVAFKPETWAQTLRVLKPGGHLLAFGGTRTFHRLACAIEDAGFEIRDTISWLYGSGFPKSLDVSKAIDRAVGAEREVVGRRHSPFTTTGDRTYTRQGRAEQGYRPAEGDPSVFERNVDDDGYKSIPVTAPATDDARRWQGWGTALKPAWEPVIVARKPLAGTVAGNVLAHGTGALNIDGCRVEGPPSGLQPYVRTKETEIYNGTESKPDTRLGVGAEVSFRDHPAGRWPANVVLDEDAAAQLDRQSGQFAGVAGGMRQVEGQVTFTVGEPINRKRFEGGTHDFGGASRFYYTAKAAPDERPRVNGVSHPTIKPLELMRWLVRLVTPPGGLVLDPFAGSGTTGEACIIEGFRCVLIEREAEYMAHIEARLSKPIQPTLGGTA